MSKRLINKSYLYNATKTIMWKLDLVFIVNANYQLSDLFSIDIESAVSTNNNEKQLNIIRDSLVCFHEENVSENETIIEIMNRYFDQRSVILIIYVSICKYNY